RALASTEAVRRRAREFQQKDVAPLAIGLAPSISAFLVLEPIAEIRKFVPVIDAVWLFIEITNQGDVEFTI
ncbi:hypothetical protein ACC711_39430, partial [Rhizobium ruizarguesonis]